MTQGSTTGSSSSRRIQNGGRDEHELPSAKRARTDEVLSESCDTGAGEKFRWKKKEVQEQRAGLSREEAERRDAERRAEAEREVERLAARREQRERARQQREEEELLRARQAEASVMADWVAKEDEFVLEQNKARAVIRVRDHRARPIDWFVVQLLWTEVPTPVPADEENSDDEGDELDDTLDMHMDEPVAFIRSLLPGELRELHSDVLTLVRLDKDAKRAAYWKDVLLVCDEQLRHCDAVQNDAQPERIDASIVADVDAMLADKSADQLLDLQTSVRAKLRSGEPLDVEYWEAMLKRIVVWRSAAKLRALHATVTQNRIAKLRLQQRREARRQQAFVAEQAHMQMHTHKGLEDVWDANEMEPAGRDISELLYEEQQLPRYTLEALRDKLRDARKQVLQQAFVSQVPAAWSMTPTVGIGASAGARAAEDGKTESVEDMLLRKEASRAMGVDEEVFDDDVRLVEQAYHWESKYEARKPRYFNRVHTGYEWNRYNQTHYDANNPPPKVVQGYKFHIFYPDLIDPFKAPTYRVQPDPDGPGETVLLRFSAGPPYEDVAFRIVQREWDYSFKRGFRSSFDRGILQLHCTCTYRERRRAPKD